MAKEIRVGRVSDFADGKRVMVEVDGREVFVLEREHRFHAFLNVCAHMGGPVGEGILIGKVEAVLGDGREFLRERFSTTEMHLVCPWHGWEYDLQTGVCAANPRFKLLKFEVVQRGEDIFVVA
jgi:nitrite reductase/ring-hydroxylating ferredoxin subunit